MLEVNRFLLQIERSSMASLARFRGPVLRSRYSFKQLGVLTLGQPYGAMDPTILTGNTERASTTFTASARGDAPGLC